MGYLSIGEATRPENDGRFFHLCCVVTEIGRSYKCQGTDYTCTLRVMDQSYMGYGVPITFFARDINQLPTVQSNSDIVILKNFKIKRKIDSENFFFNYDKKFSSFAIFAKDVVQCNRPYQTSRKYQGSEHDIGIAQQIQQWIATGPPLSGLKSLERQISSIEVGCSFDLVAQVLDAREVCSEWTLFVWDGTDAPSIEIDPTESTYALQVLPPSYVPTRPVGTSLMIISEMKFKEFNHLEGSNFWVRLCNVFIDQDSGMWKGVLQCNSMIRLLSEKDAGVVERLRIYRTRVS